VSQGWLDRHISTKHNGNVQFIDPVQLDGGFETEGQIINIIQEEDPEFERNLEEYDVGYSESDLDGQEEFSDYDSEGEDTSEEDNNNSNSNNSKKIRQSVQDSGSEMPQEDIVDTMLTRGQRNLSLKMFP
jgi:hypothetical protein